MTFPLFNGEPWTADALCSQVDAEMFYPDKGKGDTARNAKEVCKRCDVRAECLEYALAREERFGVWGGHSERERRRMTRERRWGNPEAQARSENSRKAAGVRWGGVA